MISIVIAVSNNENTIVECVNSVLTQNFNKYEVILVLNNSSDNTKLIIEKNFLKKKKIKFFVIKKVGPSAARNFGIRNSKMKYILFLGLGGSAPVMAIYTWKRVAYPTHYPF